MNSREALEALVYGRALDERNQYCNKLRMMSPDEIMDNAYELAMYRDILLVFENDLKGFTDMQLKALAELNNPLESCYNEWLDNDCSHMEGIMDAVDACATKIVNKKLIAKIKK